MRVLHVISGLGMGGAENMLWKLLAQWSRSRVQSDVISLGAGDALRKRIEETGATVTELDTSRPVGKALAPFRLVAAARRIEPDLIQGWMNHGNVAASLAAFASRRKCKVVWNIRQSLDRLDAEKRATQFVLHIGRKISPSANALLFNSLVGMEQHRRFGFRNESCVVVPNGFETEKFVPDPDVRARFRAATGIDNNAPVLGMVARYHPMKNHMMFLRVVAYVRERWPNLRALLIGPGVDNWNRDLLRGVETLGLSECCILMGEIRAMAGVYPAMDVLCLPSGRAEGFPNVIGEAMSCGVPCVGTDVGDVKEIVGDVGDVVPVNDGEAFAAAVCKVLARSEEGRARVGEMARTRILQRYSIERIASRYLELYEDILAR